MTGKCHINACHRLHRLRTRKANTRISGTEIEVGVGARQADGKGGVFLEKGMKILTFRIQNKREAVFMNQKTLSLIPTFESF